MGVIINKAKLCTSTGWNKSKKKRLHKKEVKPKKCRRSGVRVSAIGGIFFYFFLYLLVKSQYMKQPLFNFIRNFFLLCILYYCELHSEGTETR